MLFFAAFVFFIYRVRRFLISYIYLSDDRGSVSYTHLDVYKRQAIRRLEVVDLPALVIIDSQVTNLYEEGRKQYLTSLR